MNTGPIFHTYAVPDLDPNYYSDVYMDPDPAPHQSDTNLQYIHLFRTLQGSIAGFHGFQALF